MTSTNLAPEWIIGELSLTDSPYGVDADSSVDIGEPEVIVTTVPGMLADGDIEQEQRAGNRTYSLTVYIEGPDLAAVVDAETELRRELRRPGLTLTHIPGDDFAPGSVYEVLVARMKLERQDLLESYAMRKVTLTLTCAPFARSLEPVTIEALDVPTSETLVTVDTCDSATGWSATTNGVPATVDMAWQPGAVSVKEVLTRGPQTLTLTRTGSVNFSTTPYLKAEIGYNASLGTLAVTLTADGDPVPMLDQRLISPGRFLYTYDLSGTGSVSSLTFSSYTSPDYADLKIFNLDRTDMPPVLTPRQMTRFIEAGGTERTPASIHVATPNGVDGLGLTIVHTCPEDGSGYSPPLRRWRVSGNAETTASDTISGKYEPIHADPFVAEVPNTALPAGGYALVAALKTDTVGTHDIHWSLQSVFPPSTEGEGGLDGFVPVQFYLANVWHFVPLALGSLPTISSTGGAVTKVAIQYQGVNPPTIIMDDAWLFRVDDDCGLSVVNIAPGYLWLDSPDLGSPTPRVWWSGNADKSAARHPGSALLASDTHTLDPNGTAVFTATRNVDYPKVSASFYRRWHSNAAE